MVEFIPGHQENTMKFIMLVPAVLAAATMTTSAVPVKDQPDRQVEAKPDRCWQVRTKCCEKCSNILPTPDYGAKFQKCMRECMQCNGCNYLP